MIIPGSWLLQAKWCQTVVLSDCSLVNLLITSIIFHPGMFSTKIFSPRRGCGQVGVASGQEIFLGKLATMYTTIKV